MYDRLFVAPNPDKGDGDFKQYINPDSLEILKNSMLEPSLENAKPDERFQFERQGYFMIDSEASEQTVFNRTVTLRDSLAKIERQAITQSTKKS